MRDSTRDVAMALLKQDEPSPIRRRLMRLLFAAGVALALSVLALLTAIVTSGFDSEAAEITSDWAAILTKVSLAGGAALCSLFLLRCPPRRLSPKRYCVWCGYDLEGEPRPPRCPECGSSLREEWSALGPPRRVLQVAALIICGLLVASWLWQAWEDLRAALSF